MIIELYLFGMYLKINTQPSQQLFRSEMGPPSFSASLGRDTEIQRNPGQT